MVRDNDSRLGRRARILVVDDHPLVRDGLAAQIATQGDLEMCGEADDVPGAMALLDTVVPDVAIIDISLKASSGLDLIKRVKTRLPTVRILVWSMYPEDLYAQRALQLGAMGYVHKSKAASDVLGAIRSVLAGNVYVSEEFSAKFLTRLIGNGEKPAEQPSIECLSDRELEVFTNIGKGLTTKQIAETMHLSERTVETYRTRIKEKLQLENVRELTLRAVQWVMENAGGG
jgi:DNA-binding NarL/FixJ family response regulator